MTNTERQTRHLLLAAAAMAAFAPIGFTQAPVTSASTTEPEAVPARSLEWDAVAIMPAENCTTNSGMQVLKDGLHIFCLPARALIQIAWGISETSRILNAPAWATDLTYNIEAKVDEQDVTAFSNLAPESRNQMLQALIKDRFGLKEHLASRELPVYELVAAKGGPKLKKATPDEAAKPMMWLRNRGEIDAVSMPIHSLRPLLARELDRPVVDRTGLTDLYDFTLQFTPGMDTSDAARDSTAPSIFTAIQEQLGLKLEPGKAPLDVLVIDTLEKPKEN